VDVSRDIRLYKPEEPQQCSRQIGLTSSAASIQAGCFRARLRDGRGVDVLQGEKEGEEPLTRARLRDCCYARPRKCNWERATLRANFWRGLSWRRHLGVLTMPALFTPLSDSFSFSLSLFIASVFCSVHTYTSLWLRDEGKKSLNPTSRHFWWKRSILGRSTISHPFRRKSPAGV